MDVLLGVIYSDKICIKKWYYLWMVSPGRQRMFSRKLDSSKVLEARELFPRLRKTLLGIALRLNSFIQLG